MIPGIQHLKLGHKIKWVLIELVVVFLGVYFAFILNNRKEEQVLEQEQQKVYAALKRELEYFRVYFPGRANYSASQAKKWVNEAQDNLSPDYSEWRFTQPQYNYKVLEYAINIQENEIIDFDLFVSLQTIYNELLRLENTEQHLTNIAGKYRSVDPSLNPDGDEYLGRVGDNRIQLRRFVQYLNDRSENLRSTALLAQQTLELLHARMSPDYRKSIEVDLIRSQLQSASDPESMVPLILEAFPHFTATEIKKLITED